MNFIIFLLITLPACLAQFSIQGPSDGNRVAQGLRIEEGKGIEYTDQNESHDGGFSIQGATDGSAQIQGGSDGHSTFQIHGASQGVAERYNIQGPSAGGYNIQGASDGHSQPVIQGAYDGNPGTAKSLQYNDPSDTSPGGASLRVNWRSYDRQPRPAAQPEAQYSEAPIASAPRAPHRQRAHAPRQPQPPPQPEPIAFQQSKSLDTAPAHIKHLLQLQAQLPYVNIIPEPFRYENLLSAQVVNHPQQVSSQYQQPEPLEEPVPELRRPAYRGKPRGPPRHRRQAQYKPETPGASQQQYRRLPQPSAEPQIKYSPNLPPQLQQLLKYQAQAPYVNLIPEQYRFNPDPSAQIQLDQFRNYYQDLVRQQPASPVVHTAESSAPPPPRGPPRGPQYSGHPRQRRQAPRQQSHLQRQPLPAESVPRYSTNVPDHIQSLLKYQSQIPYNIIANQIEYRLEKPYVPQPAQPPAPPQVRYQPPGGSDSYQGQPSGYSQAYAPQPEYPQYTQAQLAHQQPGHGVRPVTENQY